MREYVCKFYIDAKDEQEVEDILDNWDKEKILDNLDIEEIRK